MLSFTFLFTYFADPSGGLPKFEELSEIEGEIDWVASYRDGIKFGFKGNPRTLNYPSKMNALGLVRKSLTVAGEQKFVVLADLTTPHSPLFIENTYYNVFEIRIADRCIRSYKDSAEEWMRIQRLIPFLGVLFVAFGLFVLWYERKPWRPDDTA